MPATTSDEVTIVILDELEVTGYDLPRLTSDIAKWFAKIDKADQDSNAPYRRVFKFVLNVQHRISGNPPLDPDVLIKGKRYKTPQDLVDDLTP